MRRQRCNSSNPCALGSSVKALGDCGRDPEPGADHQENWTETEAESKFEEWSREKNQKHGRSEIDS